MSTYECLEANLAHNGLYDGGEYTSIGPSFTSQERTLAASFTFSELLPTAGP